MVKITYKEYSEEDVLRVRAEGHAGYAAKGSDIVCAAVSTLMQTLAYSLDGSSIEAHNSNGQNTMTVYAKNNPENMAKFEMAMDGMYLLAEAYPEHVQVINLCADKTGAMDLQLFAEGGGDGGGDGGSAGDAGAEGGSGIVEPAMSPAEERLARCSGVLKRTGSRGAGQSSDGRAPGEKEPLSQRNGADSSLDRGALGRTGNSEQDEESSAGRESDGPAGEGDGSEAEEKAQMTSEEHKKAFHALLQGEYRAETEELMQQAVERAAQILESSPQMRGLLDALHEAYGVEDMEALTEAVKNGRVKDEAYFEKLAMEKGISVATARQMDKLESENKRLTAAEKFAEDQRKEAMRRAEIERIHAEWDREAEQLKAQYPEFDLEQTLANPEIANLMRLGVSMSNAYRAVYFDQIMAQNESRTAKQVERGVEARIRQRGTRPGENGIRPGGAAQTHTDVNALTRKEREQLERAALRGQVVTF